MSNTASVKWFNAKVGYGFLTDLDTNDDVFVHHSGISTPNDVYRTLQTGEYVQYDVSHDNKGKNVAVNVTGIRGGMLLCQHPRPQRGPRRQVDGEEGVQVASAE